MGNLHAYGEPQEKDHLLHVQQELDKEGLTEEWEALTPADNELFLDFDTNESLGLFIKQFDILKETWKEATYVLTTSKGGNKHAIVHFPYIVDQKWKIALQAALGSDPKRELLHLVSLWNGWKNPVILIERKNGPAFGGRDVRVEKEKK